MHTDPARLAAPLLSWWDEHGRHDLPWQQNINAYRVWVSEIMLQQTQVATVARYFRRFMVSFPEVQSLAAASEDAVLHHWSGLGYYSRARNLHAAARQIVSMHDGNLPPDFEALLALPGIGRSTAGAILAIAFGQRQPILDGNVRRVLARYAGIEGWPGTNANLKGLWQLADACTPSARVANYTQAIRDLGATLCSRSRPRCAECPLQPDCIAFASGKVAEIPAPKPRKQRPQRCATFVMLRHGEHEVLLMRRPPAGIWGGLWSFPELETPAAIDGWCMERFGEAPQSLREWPVVSHSFSHFDLAMMPVEVEVRAARSCVMEAGQWLWYNTRSPGSVGLAAPVSKLLAALAPGPL